MDLVLCAFTPLPFSYLFLKIKNIWFGRESYSGVFYEKEIIVSNCVCVKWIPFKAADQVSRRKSWKCGATVSKQRHL